MGGNLANRIPQTRGNSNLVWGSVFWFRFPIQIVELKRSIMFESCYLSITGISVSSRSSRCAK